MLENQEETKTPDTEESTVENQEESVDKSAEDKVTLSKQEYQELQDQLEKLKNKDTNFEALRKKKFSEFSEEDVKELLGEQYKKIEEDQKKVRDTQKQERIEDALHVLSGGDDDKREKLKHFFENDRRSDNVFTLKEIMSLMNEYAPAVGSSTAEVDAVRRVSSHYVSSPAPRQGKSFADSEAGKGLASTLGLNGLQRASNLGLKVNKPAK